MRAVSTRFLNALRGPHRATFRATLLTHYYEGTSPSGTSLEVLGGDVKLSASSDIRATLELTVDGYGWEPHSTEITPYGNEIYVERGVDLGDGGTEWVGLGYFRIYNVDQPDPPHGPLQISGRDRMSKVIDARVEKPRDFSSWDVDDIFYDLIYDPSHGDVLFPFTSGYPTDSTFVTFEDATFGNSNVKTGTVVDQDRYGFLKEIVRSGGKIFYFDHTGVLRVKDTPTATDPVWTVNAGRNGVLVELKRNLSREGKFSAVVAMGESADDTPPSRAALRDINPESPTFYYGHSELDSAGHRSLDFGPVPTFYISNTIATTDMARQVAYSMLRLASGRPSSMDLSAIPNPALEPFDPVRVNWGTSSDVHVIEDITIPLSADQAMTANTRLAVTENFEAA